MEVAPFFEGPGARIGTAGSLLVAHYRARTTLEDLEQLDRAQEALLAKYPRISTLSVIAPTGVQRPEEQVRERSLALNLKYEGRVVGSGIVVTTRGIGAVMVRTFLSAFLLLNKAKMAPRVFASISESMKWLHTLDAADASWRELSPSDVQRFSDGAT